MRTRAPTMQLESFSRRAITAALLAAVPLATTPAFAFDNALPGARGPDAAAKKTPGPPPSTQKRHPGLQRLQPLLEPGPFAQGAGLERGRRLDLVEKSAAAPVPARIPRTHETRVDHPGRRPASATG